MPARDEAERRALIFEALGDTWDPAAALAEEDAAYRMLYIGLDADQQRIYDELAGRAWPPCPNGDHGSAECFECRVGRSCGAHWQCLLSNRGTRVHL